MNRLTLFLFLLCLSPINALAQDKETAFDRVIRTGTLKCGYATWPPSIVKDPNTGEMSGYSYDVMNAVGEKLGLEVEWAEETGWGIAEQGLVSGRYDVMCADVCLDAPRTRTVWYSRPFIHIPNFIFVRSDDTRFDESLAVLNDEAMKIAIVPNTILDYAARDNFPKAQRLDINDLAGNTDVIMAVVTRKADASVNLAYAIEQFTEPLPAEGR